MKVTAFLGGTDEQRSKNLSDNKLINLYPVTNNDGSVAAFYKVDGLKSEGTWSGVPTGTYKASNGRAFYTSGTVLYELTIVAGVYTSTSRGTITTATNYEFSDNGLEMIMVNGTDGWVFKFSDNTLEQLIVLTDTFTVQSATAVDVDATLTQTLHGLSIGNRILLTTTGSLPANLLTDTLYYVLADSFTVNSFKVGLTLTGATCTISNGVDCVVTSASHNFIAGDKIRFLTTGALPSPLAVGTIYYVIADSLTADSFKISLTLGGTAIDTTTAGSGVHSFNPAITIIQTGLTECTISSTSAVGGTCTISFASPTVITKTTHGLIGGEIVKFYTDGALPSGIQQYLAYYVLASGITADTFKISTTPGGTAVNTSDAGSGTHTYVVMPAGYIQTEGLHNHVVGDSIRFATSGALPTGLAINTEYFITGYGNVTFLMGYSVLPVAVGGGYYSYVAGLLFYSTDPYLTVAAGQNIKFSTDGALPTILEAGVEYQIFKTATAGYYALSKDGVEIGQISYTVLGASFPFSSTSGLGSGLHTYLLDQSFAVCPTVNDLYGTRVTISGAQSGTQYIYSESSVAYGIHTFTSGGYGFPNGTKLISYMNGRFIAYDPNTQDFYVSEVLDGKTWYSINVQTVDSNPDYVTGHIVAHNELIVFCENSGEVYYDAGSTPTPFVRNITGIFEIGCIAPYTIKEIGGAVIFLGNSKSGKGIIYQMSGVTPVRISTYSIEYQIQQMTDISDARAFTYQKDGHHYYAITFPIGNKTFVFDASTSMWHERAEYIAAKVTGEKVDYDTVLNPFYVAFDITTGSIWVTNFSSNSVSKINITNGTKVDYATGSAPIGIAFDITTSSVWVANSGSNTVSKINITTGTKVDYATGIYPYGVAFDVTTGSVWVTNADSDSVSKVNITDGTKVDYVTGNNPYGVAFDITTGSVWVANGLSATVSKINITNGTKVDYAVGVYPHGVAFDITTSSVWVSNTTSNTVSKVNITTGTKVDYTTGLTPHGVAFDITTGSVWVANYGSNTVSMIDITDGTKVDYATGLTPYGVAFDVTTGSVWVANYGADTVSKISIQNTTESILEWPVNKYLYFNNEHLITDDTTTLYSIDSSTYKNGFDPIKVIRSFRAPPSDMKRIAHHTIQVDCEVGVGPIGITEPVVALRWSDDAGNTWSTPIERGLGLVGDHAKTVIFRRLGSTKGIPRIYELSCDENVKITLLDCYLE